jgi:acyl-CoA dehydrogenase
MTSTIYLTAEHDAFRSRVRTFLDREIVPFADEWEAKRCLPREAWKAFAREGFLGLLHAKSVGGSQQGLFHSVVFLEELGATGYGGLRAAISVHAYMASHYLAAAGPIVERAYLVPAVGGERIAALAVTEAQAGSDLALLALTASADDQGFVLSGEKTMVTNGTTADFLVVAARTGRPPQTGRPGVTGLSLVVVDGNSQGLTRTPLEKIGWHSSGTACIRFDDVKVPSDHVVGRLNTGFYQLMRGFQLERLVAAVLAVGGADRCLRDTVRHLKARRAFEGTLANLQAVRHRIADAATRLAAARHLIYHAAWAYETRDLPVEECSMAKLMATELASDIAVLALQLHGSHGYLAEAAVARAYRDAPAATIAAGPSEVMRDIIAHTAIDEA